MRAYTHTRPRGFASWRPQAKTLVLLDQVRAVLDEYADFLPLTLRQLFYRLVGAHSYPKDERAYDRLCETLNRARRARLIPFEAIRDDGPVERDPGGFHGLPGFWEAVRAAAGGYRRDRLEGQAVAVELWVEAAGMVPQLERAAWPRGVPVYSSGGFDSLTVKHEAAERFAMRSRPTVVLHVGDFDPSGLSIFDSAAEDIGAMLDGLGAGALAEFRRIAVTPDQIADYRLETAPVKATDRRGGWQAGTVQVEALAPDQLVAEVTVALEAVLDPDTLEAVIAVEEAERRDLLRELDEQARGE